MSLWWPVNNVVVSGEWANSPAFYAKFNMRGHNGIDLSMGVGTPVYAADAGVVQFEGWGQNNSWMGNPAGICVLLRHSWGYTGYAHLSNTVINNGQPIAKGQLIGHSGNTGASTGPHLHFETLPPNPDWRNGFAGRVNPRNYGLVPRGSNEAPPALQPNQRQVAGEPVNRRVEPNTSKPPIDPQLAPGVVGDFDGWIRGESVNGNNIWFRGLHSGNWFWSGGFTSQSTANLTDLNPPPAPPAPANPAERTVGTNSVRRRSEPNTASKVLGELAAGDKVIFEGYTTGEKVTDSVASTDLWYRHKDGWWAWAGAFTKVAIDGLTKVDQSAPPAPQPPVKPEPAPSRKPVTETIPDWNGSAPVENPVYNKPVGKATIQLPATIEERTQPANSNGYTQGRPDKPNHIVLHHTAGTSLSGALAALSGAKGAPTASYAVQDNQLVSMVPEDSAPWTNGRWASNMYSVTFEMVNAGSNAAGFLPPSAATCETTAWAMARAAIRWDMQLPLEHGVNVFGHREVSKTATACPGALDIAAIVKRANEIITSEPVGNSELLTKADLVGIADALDTISKILRSA